MEESKVRVKVVGKAIPMVLVCGRCGEHCLLPDGVGFDELRGYKGWICYRCKSKHRLRFNENINRWETQIINEG
ncbi:MAG: hypothetical protein QW052_06205 [Candidatus Nitrosocaldaceae archaeon]